MTHAAEFASTVKPPQPGTVHPLVEQLVSRHGGAWVDTDTVDDWLAGPGERVLFFGGDPVRFPECLDVAVVLPELRRHVARPFEIGVALPSAEDALARRFGSQRWPALVFLRDGGYVATVSGMLDWDVYVAEVGRVGALPISRAPGIGIALVSAREASACSSSSCH
jgi:hydrogenase-1 operon protein HyaE